jgi:uncharacterized protein YbcC (UPF0753/DUF2309 family)
VDQITVAPYSETQRMQLRALIRLASEIVGYYWPMRTFVHHNPLHGLEDCPFDEATRRAEKLLGGKGYLSNEVFRDYFRSGRILPGHLDAVLKPLAHEQAVKLGTRVVSQLEVLRAHFIQGVSAPPDDMLEMQLQRHPDRPVIATLADHLASAAEPPAAANKTEEEASLGRRITLSAWCDGNLGTQIAEQINREMIKWCEAFLDEGHAAWPLPGRDKGFYAAWKFLARREWSPCAIANSGQKLARLPAHPEDALLESLAALGVPPEVWQDYLSLHLAGLAGWAGFIKWRADQSDYEWQQRYPIDLVQYLAVRLWYERELVQKTCRETLGIGGDLAAVSAHMRSLSPGAHEAKRAPAQAARLASWRLTVLAKALAIDATVLLDTPAENLRVLLAWIDAVPESNHGPLWLKAFEAGYQEELMAKLQPRVGALKAASSDRSESMAADKQKPVAEVARSGEETQRNPVTVRPQAQAVFCIDVRSEPLRRHLEATGDYETFGFAGFFNAVIRYQALGSDHETDQFPVILKAKNLVREIPRSYQGQFVSRHRARAKLIEAGHMLLHDLKENVATPYVMVESLGWFYSLPMIGKTVLTRWYANAIAKLRRRFLFPVATTLTVDKLSRDEVEEMLAAEQRATARRALQEKFGDRQLNLSLERLEFLRRRALDEQSAGEPPTGARSYALSAAEENAFVEDLRRSYGINQHAAFARAERITRTGFTPSEQAFTVESALRIMGLTRNFARLVLFCGHGSTSENNPFEAALDCGACGGNPGNPNARVLALMANKPSVREHLGKNGIVIPQDTYFIAGQHDTTTDNVDLFDLEDIPPTHRKDLLQLTRDLEHAALENSRERCGRFPEINVCLSSAKAAREAHRRSSDWSQVRPEWGLSRNAAFIVGRRALTRAIDLDGRAFLQSYDHREDPTGRLLEVVMTGPQVVAQWINMEHYFSTVDQDVYGSASKIYHNVVGRLGIMAGPQSDLRTGLAWQTVMNGPRPYHEPMRLLTLIEAPRQRIDAIIRGHRLLQHLYDNEWVRLMAIEPEEELFYRYIPKQGWQAISEGKGE